jgi:hypothetical protein
VHIFSNMVDQSIIQRGPAGLLQSQIRADLAGKNGPLAADTARGRLGAGIALSVVGGGLAMEGLLTPSAPSDPNEARVWRMIYGTPHSFRIGEMAYDLSRLGPIGILLGISADLYHASTMIGKEAASKVAHYLVHSFTQNFMDEGFLQGPSNLIKALDEPDQYGARFVRDFIASFAVSQATSALARQIDPYAREARTLLDEIKAKVPWLSETLMPRRDIWGQPIPNREYWGVYATQTQDDPVNRALERLGIFPAPVERVIRGVELTDRQYDDFARIAGINAKMRVSAIVNQPGFAALPFFAQHDLVQKAIEGAREQARGLVMMQNQSIPLTALKAKQDLVNATSPAERPGRRVPQPAQ